MIASILIPHNDKKLVKHKKAPKLGADIKTTIKTRILI